MPIFFAVLMTRQAISPRLAMRILLNMGLCGLRMPSALKRCIAKAQVRRPSDPSRPHASRARERRRALTNLIKST
jgi:hypothetical protein